MIDGEDRPLRHGQLDPLSGWHDAIDSKDRSHDGESEFYRVHGRIVRVSEVDMPASNHFLMEVLKWTICMEAKSKVAAHGGPSHDTAVQPIKAGNVSDMKKRFPGAFAEYKANYDDFGLPKAGDIRFLGGHIDGSIGAYVPPKPLPKPKVDVAKRRAQLMAELSELDGPEEVTAEPQAVIAEPQDAAEYGIATSIADFVKIPAKARERLQKLGFQTVGDLAALPDEAIPELGAGKWHQWRLEADTAINGSLTSRAA